MDTEKSTLLAPSLESTATPNPSFYSIVDPSVHSLTPTLDKTLQGSVLVLIQFDVCEEIRLDALRDIFGARRQDASFKHPAPG